MVKRTFSDQILSDKYRERKRVFLEIGQVLGAEFSVFPNSRISCFAAPFFEFKSETIDISDRVMSFRYSVDISPSVIHCVYYLLVTVPKSEQDHARSCSNQRREYRWIAGCPQHGW